MASWHIHEGQAIALPMPGIDTDQLLPARFMSTPRGDGYGRFLMHDLRFDEEGSTRRDFPLNRHQEVSVIVAGRNFGGGSSREAAVYALVDFGIRAVLAPSFGDIFASNAVNNGLLPAVVSEADEKALVDSLGDHAHAATVCLDSCTITVGERTIAFDLDRVWRTKLTEGWDDIDLTASHTASIAAFGESDRLERPWAYLDAQHDA
ncbi:MAG: 3-isopropylmalate dehydratase small subunit [Pseudomonadota bacterium]